MKIGDGEFGMGHRDDLQQAFFAQGGQRGLVTGQDGFVRLGLRQCRIDLRKLLDAVERKHELEIHRLFGPERAVIVEDGDAFFHRHEISTARLRGALDEGENGLFGPAFVPRRQRIPRPEQADHQVHLSVAPSPGPLRECCASGHRYASLHMSISGLWSPHAAKADMAHRAVNRFGVARGRPVSPAIIRRA